MAQKARIFEILVESFIGDADEISTYLKSRYDVQYVCIFSRHHEMYIGVQFTNRILLNKVSEMFSLYNIKIRSIYRCKKFIGKMLSEHGIRKTAGAVIGRRLKSDDELKCRRGSVHRTPPPLPQSLSFPP